MVILIDVGNSSTSYALYREGRLTKIGHADTRLFPKITKNLITRRYSVPNCSIVMTSVVPSITAKVAKICRSRGCSKTLWIVGRNFRVPISHKYKNINKLGSDRLVNVYGAIRLYKPPLLILDYGTALTCDYISEKGVLLGGLIIPGPEISLKALSEKAALLPTLDFPRKYTSFIGRDTQGGMKAGILQGYGAMTDGLVERFRRRFGSRFQVIATGGFAKVISPYTRTVDILDPHLTLKSLAKVYQDLVKIP